MTEETCTVCGEPIPSDRLANCNNCHQPYHLRTREDQPGEDCGEVWIHEQYLSLEYACNNCLGKGAQPAEPAVGGGH